MTQTSNELPKPAPPDAEPTATILLVDDDDQLRRLVRDYLAAEGFAVREACDGAAMRRELENGDVDLVILDVMMPGEDGHSLAQWLSHESSVGIIMLSALGSETDKVVGLDIGADDYLAKPVAPRELLSRIRALLRRQSRHRTAVTSSAVYHFAQWQLDPVQRTLRDPGGVVIGLSAGEFRVLHAFLEHPGEVLTRDVLLDMARGTESEAFDCAIDTQISRLRRKLLERSGGETIRTVRNEGYLFVPPVTRG